MRKFALLVGLAMASLPMSGQGSAEPKASAAGPNSNDILPAAKSAQRISGPGGGGYAGRLFKGAAMAPNPPGAMDASTSLKCGDTFYLVSVDGGKCTAGKDEAECIGPSGGKSSASCGAGCGATEYSGACTAVPD